MSKSKKVFYGCTGFPDCDFASWDIPYDEKCPTCGEFMVVKLNEDTRHIKCSKCNYERKEKIEKEEDNK